MGVQLERYLARQGCTIDEAVARVLSNVQHAYTEREVRGIVRTLPIRPPLRPELVSDDDAVEVASEHDASVTVDEGERLNAATTTAAALTAALAGLEAEDRIIVSMRFLDGCSVAEVARALSLEQKSLYRRLDRLLQQLRLLLEQHGVSRDTIGEMLAEGGH